MGCCQTKVSRSAAIGGAELAVDPQSVELILSFSDLKQTAEQCSNSNLPRIIKALSDLTCRLDNALSVADSSHEALLAYQREMNKRKQNKRKKGKKKHTENVFAEVTAAIDNLELAGDNLEAPELLSALGDLKNTMDRIPARKATIEKRMRSVKWWRKVWSVAFTAAFIGAMLAVVGLAVSGMSPMAISAATAFATAVKAVETWINTALDEKEKELKHKKEIVEEMCEGELLVRKLESVQPELKKVSIDYRALVDNAHLALREENKATLAVVVAEMENMLRDVDSAIQVLKRKASEWAVEIQQAQSKLNKAVKKLEVTILV